MSLTSVISITPATPVTPATSVTHATSITPATPVTPTSSVMFVRPLKINGLFLVQIFPKLSVCAKTKQAGKNKEYNVHTEHKTISSFGW